MRLAVLAAGAAALLLAGCAGQGAGAPSAAGSGDSGGAGIDIAPISTFQPDDPLLTGAPTGEASNALGLVGEWQLADAEGDAAGTFVWTSADMHGQSITVFRDCGVLQASWAGSDDLLVTGSIGGSQDCFSQPDGSFRAPDVPWLTEARGFRVVGDGWELLDSTGAPVARLDPADGAPPAEILQQVGGGAPVAGDEARAALARRAPLAEGLTAASLDELVGTWSPVGLAPSGLPDVPPTTIDETPPMVEDLPEGSPLRSAITFRDDGSYTVDDCRHQPLDDGTMPEGDGLAFAGDGSDFLAPGYAINLLLCWPSWPLTEIRTRTIALDNGYLRLFDVSGDELGRLERVG
ncbi:hypothetical protein N1028_05005 [Herbiconiux sp. CPCC 203407]|uniref:META domain-containing protein n=1 Tax=Herbiconiux oxytropis TaxID=2970915 RepID=A0AA41XFI4_9MICO|nr:hypothetical protein [Herbiconiux oxytropis]MCS5723749.1 hypothetical protein [Herbiconiux oxytropis]MCS5725249.1 hypothetical protein [Herbiconiux oxytropis]